MLEIALTVLLTATVTLLLAYRLVDRFSLLERFVAVNDGGGTYATAVPEGGPSAGFEGRMEALDETEPEILTDEDRVIQMLRSNGGQLQQMTIVEDTDWSKSKVSRLLSRMEEQGQIEKISVGRENLITLRDPQQGRRRQASGRE